MELFDLFKEMSSLGIKWTTVFACYGIAQGLIKGFKIDEHKGIIIIMLTSFIVGGLLSIKEEHSHVPNILPHFTHIIADGMLYAGFSYFFDKCYKKWIGNLLLQGMNKMYNIKKDTK